MNAPRIRTVPSGRIRTLPFCLLLLTFPLSACAPTGPPRYWTEFAPTYSNFQRRLDERSAELDPIEGVWSPQGVWPQQPTQPMGRLVGGDFAIVRDSTYDGYQYVGIRCPEPDPRRPMMLVGDSLVDIFPGTEMGEIFIALRRVVGTSGLYEYADAAVLRGDNCADEPCWGTLVITTEGELIRGRSADEVRQPGRGWVRRYPRP